MQMHKNRNKRRKFCEFAAKNKVPDYKDLETLEKFLDDCKRIVSSHYTGTGKTMQQALTTAIKQARFLGLLPYTDRHKE